METGPPRQERSTACHRPEGCFPFCTLTSSRSPSHHFRFHDRRELRSLFSATAHTISHQAPVMDVKSNPDHCVFLNSGCNGTDPGSFLTREVVRRKISLFNVPAGIGAGAQSARAKRKNSKPLALPHLEELAGDGRASKEEGEDPDILFACSGDSLTLEVLAKSRIAQSRRPDWLVRVVPCWFWAFLKDILMISTNRASTGCFPSIARSSSIFMDTRRRSIKQLLWERPHNEIVRHAV